MPVVVVTTSTFNLNRSIASDQGNSHSIVHKPLISRESTAVCQLRRVCKAQYVSKLPWSFVVVGIARVLDALDGVFGPPCAAGPGQGLDVGGTGD